MKDRKHGHRRAALVGLLSTSVALHPLAAASQTYPSPGAPILLAQNLAQTLRRQQYQEESDEQERERIAHLPHAVSAAHQGGLTPVDGLQGFINGKTIYLQTPIVQDDQVLRVEVAPIYFAPSGQAYSSDWANRPWTVNGSSLCIASGNQPECMTALSDSTGQAFVLGPTNLLVQVGKISPGDAENVQQAYEEEQAKEAAAQKAFSSFVMPILLGALMGAGGRGGGGGGGGGDSNAEDPSRAIEEYNDRQYNQPVEEPAPDPVTPIGGDNGLYGANHGVGDSGSGD